MKSTLPNQYVQLIQLVLAALAVLVGNGLLIAGFCVEPVGEIGNSVLVAYGETFTFAGAVFGVDYHHRYRPTQPPKSSNNENPSADTPNS